MEKLLIHYLMKMTRAFILIFSILVVSSSLLTAANSYGQDADIKEVYLTIDVHQAPLKKVFKNIKRQTKFSFFYDANSFNVNQPVTIKASNLSLFDILHSLSKQSGLEFKQIKNQITVRPKRDRRHLSALKTIKSPFQKRYVPKGMALKVPHSSYDAAKDTLIKGTVLDDQANPLIGVTVKVKKGNAGAVTNSKGQFSLSVSPKDTLVFSYVGYKNKIVSVKNLSSNVVLSTSTSGLNEVIVVGYGTQKKQDVTSSVSQVSGEDIRKTPTASLQNALTGKLPGLFSQQRSGQPGGASAAKINIRGVATFTDQTNPLVLVDNVEYNFGQLFLIDPNAIKSVTILKDAAATSIYGIKGANGVILITTKRGKAGKPVIHFKTQAGIQTPVHRLKTLNAYQSALLQNEGLRNAGNPPLFSIGDLMLFKSGRDPYGHPDVDWTNEILKEHTLMTNNNLDISGGGKRVRYFISMGYLWQNGLIRDIPYKGPNAGKTKSSEINNNNFMKRYKFRSNLDIDATNSLHLQLDLAGTHEEANYPEANPQIGTMYKYYYLNPYMYPVYNPNGTFGYANPNRLAPANNSNNLAGIVSLGGYDRHFNDFMNVDLSAKQKLDVWTKGLSVKTEVAYSFANTASRELSRNQKFPSYWFNAKDSTYRPRDPKVSRIGPYQLNYSGGTPNQRLNLQASINYKRSFGASEVGGLLLYNQTSYYHGANPPDNFRGYTFRFTYNYRHKYLFEVSGAYNGSSKFVTQKRYQLFPAFSAGYNIAKESFFKEVLPFIGTFKIRGSYGLVGTDLIGSGNKYLYESVYRRTNGANFGETSTSVTGIIPSQKGNNDVSWQTERKTDIGLDFSLFKGRLSGSIDYFDNYRYDILTKKQTVPLYFGVTAGNLPPVNIGKVSNKGYEVELNYKANIGKVGIHIKGTYSFAKNKILYIDEPPTQYPWQVQTGQSVGAQKQYIWTGKFYKNQKDIDNSPTPPGKVAPGYLKYKDLNGDSIINQYDMAYTGYPNLPNTNIGLTIGLSYKGFNFSVLLQSALHSDVYSGFDKAVPFRTVLQPIHLDRWTPATASSATFPLMTTLFNGSYMSPRGNLSSFWTVSGDYLKIRSMYLSYNFPKEIVSHIGLEGLKVFLNGYNLFTWSKVLDRYQFDPEVSPSSNSFVYPIQRIFNFGLNLTFK